MNQSKNSVTGFITRNKKIFLGIILILSVPFIGLLLDTEMERMDDQAHQRDKNGVILGAQTRVFNEGNKSCLLVFTGHLGTPNNFLELIEHAKRNSYDIVVLRSPFHGKSLKEAKKFDNEIIYNKFKETILDLSKKYSTLGILGFSYGGLQLLNLINRDDLPKNTIPILYAPAVNIKTNTKFGYFLAKAYGWFRSYCNYDYPSIGLVCKYPALESADPYGHNMILKEISLKARVIPSIIAMYDLDDALRGTVSKIKRKFHLLISDTDNRIHSEKLISECQQNKAFCKLHRYQIGRHLLHYSEKKIEFFDQILQILQSQIKVGMA